MSYIWFNQVLEALGKKLNYESISNIYGNSFCKDPQKIVVAANPLVKNAGKNIHSGAAIMQMAGTIKITELKDDNIGDVNTFFKDGSDVSWAEEFMKD